MTERISFLMLVLNSKLEKNMEDRYLKYTENLRRLQEEYRKYQTLYIAIDFDNTIYDYHQIGDSYPIVESLLKQCKQNGMKLILFTANEGIKLEQAISYCQERAYRRDYVNESPIMATRKPFDNLLLDDRAGLYESNKLLTDLLNHINKQS